MTWFHSEEGAWGGYEKREDRYKSRNLHMDSLVYICVSVAATLDDGQDQIYPSRALIRSWSFQAGWRENCYGTEYNTELFLLKNCD